MILVIIDQFTKIVHYKPVKITINAFGLIKVIINKIIWHYNLFNLIISNCKLVFSLKSWLLLYYFLNIKQKLFIVFYSELTVKLKNKIV